MNFSYSEPTLVEEAIRMMKDASENKKKAVYLAGGTDLFPLLKRNITDADVVINLKGISGLNKITEEEDEIAIGALTSLHSIARSSVVKEFAPAVYAAADRAATPALRRMGTLGGNLLQTPRCPYYNQSDAFRAGVDPCYVRGGKRCHKDADSKRCIRILMAEMVPPLIAANASAVIAGADGERTVSLESLYGTMLLKAKVKPAEILKEIRIPKRPESQKACYLRMAERKTIDYPAVNMGISVEVEKESGICGNARIVAGSIACGPVIMGKTAALIEGKQLSEELAAAAAQAAADELEDQIVESPEFPKWYRLEIVKKMVRDTLTAFLEPEYEQDYTNPPLAAVKGEVK